ncbi:MAG: hybrid sensor histidine kinase/response regulator, partial [Desulfobacula sp.]|nr:hybrid sensor histidine kinase/response regulator [Desulfobacula sp.]
MSQKFFLATVIIGLYFTTFVNYLFFHSIVEIFSIVVACSFFMITWNSKNYIKNQYILFIGIAYLFIALLDLLHTLAYKGMPIFTDYDYYANQLWIGARYLESITLILAFYFMRLDKNYKPELIFMAYALITTLIVFSIFVWKVFPVCFVDGIGLTPFKKISEYIICTILLSGIYLFSKNKKRFEPV